MEGILRQRQLHWWIQRPDLCQSGPKPWPNLPQFSNFSPDLGHFIFKLQNFDIFMFHLLCSFLSGDRSPHALRARLADSAGCAGLCTDVAEPQAFFLASSYFWCVSVKLAGAYLLWMPSPDSCGRGICPWSHPPGSASGWFTFQFWRRYSIQVIYVQPARTSSLQYIYLRTRSVIWRVHKTIWCMAVL